MTHNELLMDLATHFYRGRPSFPIKRQPINEPWRDRLERWLDDKVTRQTIKRGWNAPMSLWFKCYRLMRRSRIYQRFVLEQS